MKRFKKSLCVLYSVMGFLRFSLKTYQVSDVEIDDEMGRMRISAFLARYFTLENQVQHSKTNWYFGLVDMQNVEITGNCQGQVNLSFEFPKFTHTLMTDTSLYTGGWL